MSDVETARQRIAALRQEIADLEQFVALGQRLFGTKPEQSEPRELEPPRPTIRTVRKRVRPADFAEMAARFIKEAGHPLSRSELVERFDAGSVELPSQDKARYIGTILWRNRDRFVNVAGQGYGLAEMMTPEEAKEHRQLGELMDYDSDVAGTDAENTDADDDLI